MRSTVCFLLASAAALLAVAGGATGASRQLTVVALGDSIPYGNDCGGCTGYVELYARNASRALGAAVKVDNRAEHNNLDSRRLLAQIRTNAAMRAAARRADIVTLTIGHNDTPWASNTDPCDGSDSDTNDNNAIDWASYTGPCLGTVAAELRSNVSGILAEIKRLRAGKPTAIRVTNFHDDNIHDPTMPAKSYGSSKAVDDALNTAICRAAASAKVPCADVYHAFNGPSGTRFDGPYVAADHVHPNQKGHTLIAALLVKFGYAPLRHS